jgi:hypothetical protein
MYPLNKINFGCKLKTKDNIIKIKDEENAFQVDFKQKLSTKMVGESLEQHCEIEFKKFKWKGYSNKYLKN